MDDDSPHFWANVLKRWSSTFDEVIHLKEEIAELRRERDEHRAQADAFLKQTQDLISDHLPQGRATDVRVEEAVQTSTEIHKLQELLNFANAKIEQLSKQNITPNLDKSRALKDQTLAFKKQQEELDLAKQEIKHLQSLNAVLSHEKMEATAACHATSKELQACQQDALQKLSDIQEQGRTACNALSQELQATKQVVDQLQDEKGLLEIRFQQAVRSPNLVGRLERELDLARQKLSILSSAEHEQCIPVSEHQRVKIENQQLRSEVNTKSAELQKMRELNKSLLATINNLQDMGHLLARPTLPSSIETAPQSTPPGGHTMSFPTSKPDVLAIRRARLSLPSQPQNYSSPLTKGEPSVTASMSTRLTTNFASLPPPYVTPIPQARRGALDGCSAVTVDATDAVSPASVFTRAFLSRQLGGNIQPLVVRIGKSRTQLAAAYNISSYLCPNLDLNPWCPSSVGQHGYMFMGPGLEQDTFRIQELHHVFVGVRNTSTNNQPLFRYMGHYSAVRVAPLTVSEWRTLANYVKQAYVEKTKEKNKDLRSLAVIRSEYDAGKLLVPCVQLTCVGYNEELVAALSKSNRASSRPFKSANSPSTSKRKRDVNEDAMPRGRHRSSRHSDPLMQEE